MRGNKRTRENDSDSDFNDDTGSNINTTEAAYRAIGILLNDSRAGKVTKQKVISEKMGMRWAVCKGHINKILQEKYGLRVEEVPEGALAEKGPRRREVVLTSNLSPEGQKILNKYTNKRNLHYASKQRLIILFVIAEGDDCTDQVLFQRILRLKLFENADQVRACVQKLLSMRLLQSRKQTASGTDATIIYSTGPAASLLLDKEQVIAQLKELVGYDNDNQIPEIRERNEAHIRDLVERSLQN